MMGRKKLQTLSAIEISRLATPGLHFVGHAAGLALNVTRNGSKNWILRYMLAGRRRDLGLGGYPTVTLAAATAAARVARENIRQGIDPVESARAERQQRRSAALAEQAAAVTFRKCAETYIDGRAAEWKNPKHGQQWRTTLETYVFPFIGDMIVREIDTPHVKAALDPIWLTRTETATRVRNRIELILNFAKVSGYRSGENPARWKGHLDNLLPRPTKVAKTRNHAALPWKRVGSFWAALAELSGAGSNALRFAILTATRSGEVRGARWREFDLEEGVWTIPADRMKAGKEHRVPLSRPALELLRNLPRSEETDLAFPNAKGGSLSDMVLTATIKRMHEVQLRNGEQGWIDPEQDDRVITAHGFRSTFRVWAGETTAYPREVIEHALAHQLKDKTEAAYQRGDLFDKRARLMNEWAAFVLTPSAKASGDVVPIQKHRSHKQEVA